jgi:hypothetical protein
VITKFANGKTAIINARDNSNFTDAQGVVEKFFAGSVEINTSGIEAK